VEITFTVPGASGVIEHLAKQFSRKILLGRARFSIRKPRALPFSRERNLWSVLR
jgi:hypothetical protein